MQSQPCSYLRHGCFMSPPSLLLSSSNPFYFVLITLQLVRKFIHDFNRKTQVNFLTNAVPPSTKICVKLLPDISFPCGEKFDWLPNSASYLPWPLRLLPSLSQPPLPHLACSHPSLTR